MGLKPIAQPLINPYIKGHLKADLTCLRVKCHFANATIGRHRYQDGSNTNQSSHLCVLVVISIVLGPRILTYCFAYERQSRSIRRNRCLWIPVLSKRRSSRQVFWWNGAQSNDDQKNSIAVAERAASFSWRCVYGNSVVPGVPR